MKLRTNQIEPVRIGIEFFNKASPRPSLMVEPVAFGKSVVIAHIAKGINGKTIVLQPSKELLEQNYGKFKALGGEASIYSASMKQKEFGDVTYATIGSIKDIGDKFSDYQNLIIDEADRYPRSSDSMLGKFLATSKIKKVLGFTATPFKLQTNSVNMESYSIIKLLTSVSKHGNFFKEIIHVTQIQDIIKDKFWSPLLYEQYDFDTGDLVYNSTKAEYTDDSISKAYENQNVGDRIAERIADLNDSPLLSSRRRSIVVFVPTVAEAKRLETIIPSSVAVYGDMPAKERDKAVQLFKSQQIQVAVNVNVLSIGFDYPEIDCIILGRPTASLSLSYQQMGRGTRLHPNKENCLIIDFVGNTKKFGKIEDLYLKRDNIWKLYGTGGVLLSGVPIHTIGEITEEKERKELIIKEKAKQAFSEGKKMVTFGRFKGKLVHETPIWWRSWVLQNMDLETTDPKLRPIIDEIIRLKNNPKD